MRFLPDYTLQILPEASFGEAIAAVEQTLAACKQAGRFTAFDGVEIYYEYFLAQDSRASVVIVHGLSEFIGKFYEMIHCLLRQGYNVFLYDQRCHGYSGRLTDEMDLLHVDHFEDYVEDLSQFIHEIVIPTEDKPIYLYSHSMGGAVSALYLAQHPDTVQKAVMAAPMFVPVVRQVPLWLARCSTALGRWLLGGKTKFFLSSEFNPNVTYKEEYGTSRARFEHNMQMRRSDLHYRSTPMSFGWIHNSLTVGPKIFRRQVIGRIRTPILLLSAEKDTTVMNLPQRRFAQKCDCCTFREIPNETHALLAANDAVLQDIMQQILDFFA